MNARAARTVLIAGGAAAAGFVVGSTLRQPVHVEPSSRGFPSSVSASASLRIDPIDFSDPKGFQASVDQMVAAGLPVTVAEWTVLREKSAGDLATSFEIARAKDLLGLWVSGAAEVDPEAALELIASLPRKEASLLFEDFFSTLGKVNPEAGLALVDRLPPGSDFAALRAFIASWTETTPFEEVGNHMFELPSARIRRSAVFGVFKAWAEVDREAMLRWARSHGTYHGRMAFRSLNDHQGPRNPQELLSLADRYPDTASWFILATSAGALADEGQDGLSAILRMSPDFPFREDILPRFAREQTRRDPEEAWRMLEMLSPADRRIFLRGASDGLARTNPMKVAELLKPSDLDVSSRVMEEWARQNAGEAMDWTAQNLSGGKLVSALNRIVETTSESDPSAASSAIERLSPGLRARFLPAVAGSYGRVDPNTGLSWARGLPAIDRNRAIGGVIRGWAAEDAAAAADALAEIPPDGLADTFDSVAHNLTAQSPDEATKWAGNLRDDDTKNRVIEQVTGSWGRSNAEAAAEYLSGLPAGGFRDHAISGFVRSVSGLDPETAAAWGASIQDEGMRARTVRWALLEWRGVDRTAASAFVAKLRDGTFKDDMSRLVSE